MKQKYRLLINGNSNVNNKFAYNYGKSNNIVFYFVKGKATIEYNSANQYDLSDSSSYLYKLLKEGLKRICLVYYIKYETPFNINSVKLLSNKKAIDVTGKFKIHSLLNKKPIRPIDKSLKNNITLQKFIKTNKTKYNEKISALYSYLYSKTKEYEIERFSYLWMSFNSFYTSLPNAGRGDKIPIENLLTKYGIGKKISTQKIRNSYNTDIILYLNNNRSLLKKSNLFKDQSKFYKKFNQLINKRGVELTPYGYVLGELSYYIRCNLFHGNKPLLLFCYNDDLDYQLLKFASNIIEDFLNLELYKLV